MVTSITSLTGNGLKDWLIQRVSAVYLAVYVLFLIIFLAGHAPLSYDVWHHLFHMIVMKVATSLAILMLVLHAWIGIWTVTTDYINCTAIRLSIQLLVALFLGAQFIWGLYLFTLC